MKKFVQVFALMLMVITLNAKGDKLRKTCNRLPVASGSIEYLTDKGQTTTISSNINEAVFSIGGGTIQSVMKLKGTDANETYVVLLALEQGGYAAYMLNSTTMAKGMALQKGQYMGTSAKDPKTNAFTFKMSFYHASPEEKTGAPVNPMTATEISTLLQSVDLN